MESKPNIFSCFENKVAVITGGGGSLGGGSALLLALYGARLALIDNHQGRLDTICDKLRAQGLPSDKLFAMNGDVMSEGDTEKFVEDTISQFGQIDYVINVVGIKRLGNMEKSTLENIQDNMIDIYATFNMTKACLPHLLKSKGAVVNLSSVAGIVSYGHAIPYGTVKSALNQMTKNMALDLAGKGVRVNAICPSSVRCDYNVTSGNFKTQKELEEYLEMAGKVVPMGRVAYVEEITQAILFLLSDAASFITGVILPVDGGYVLSPCKG